MGFVTRIDYVLIALGIFLIFAYGLGLILLAIAAWHIGTRMENLSQSEDLQSSNIEYLPQEQEEEDASLVESKSKPNMASRWLLQKTYNEDEYSNRVLEDGK